MNYRVYITETFEKEISCLNEGDKKLVEKTFQKLKVNPYSGDIIRYKFFREKRIKEKRIYYLIYENFKIVLIVAFGGKKTQQETINKIIGNFSQYNEYTKKIFS